MLRGAMDVSTDVKRLLGLILVTGIAGCADSQIMAPERPLTILDGAPVPRATAPVAVTLRDVVADPLDPSTEIHTFDELPLNCMFGDTLPNPYEGMSFESATYYSACPSPNGTPATLPANPYTLGEITEAVIDLPRPAVSVSLEVYDVWKNSDLTLKAYDASGNLAMSTSDPTNGAWITLTVGGGIHRLRIASDQGNTFVDNLTITYAPEVEDGPADAGACKHGGWSGFGFKNQGQCVRFVETGKDSR